VDFPYTNNIATPYFMEWIGYVSGVTGNLKFFSEVAFWIQKYTELYLSHAPFKEFDKIVGIASPAFQTMVSHATPEPYFTALVPKEADYRRFNLPILTVTGIYDTDQLGSLAYYRRHQKYGSPEGFSKHYLMIGPWDHAGTRTPNREVGGLRFGEASLLDMNMLLKSWYDWVMKKGEKPAFLKKKIAYYVTGQDAETWKYADDLEAIPLERKTFYLHSNGQANDVFVSGSLNADKPGEEKPDRYVYDPLDTRPAEIEQDPAILMIPGNKNPLTDQRYALNLYGNGLIYHSPPFSEAVEITGTPTFAVWMAMDVPDTDFEVFLYEILPDGRSVLLTQDKMRARYRESLVQEKLVKPGEFNLYEFKSFYFFSRKLSKGSRLRLLLRSPNTIYFQKNYNSGGIVAEESGKDARTAHITLYHDARHPSRLEIPITGPRRDHD
jgi:putative CocE/NonD family hydrolase